MMQSMSGGGEQSGSDLTSRMKAEFRDDTTVEAAVRRLHDEEDPTDAATLLLNHPDMFTAFMTELSDIAGGAASANNLFQPVFNMIVAAKKQAGK